MGNKDSKGGLLLTCESVSVYAGDEITGHIYLQLNSKIKKKVTLSLVFSGSEAIEWNSGILDMKKDKKRFKKEKKIVFEWESGLHQGQYDFPFSFLLDSKLIPSFSIKEKSYGAKIEYFLHAVVLGKDSKLKNSVNIEILGQGATERVPLGLYKELKFKQCCQKQVIHLKGQLNSNIYFSDENLTYELTYSSQKSTQSLKDIEVSLVRKLLLKSSDGSRFFTKSLFTKSLRNLKNNQTFSGTFALKNDCESLSKGKTLKSRLISCIYFFRISHSTDSTCSQLLEPFENELTIFSNKSFMIPIQVQAPDDWNPQSFPLSRMSFKDFQPSAPEYIEDN